MRDAPDISGDASVAGLRRVFFRDLRIDASIGVHPHELAQAQPIVVSLDLRVAPAREGAHLLYTPPPREGDALARDVVCYESLSNMVRKVAAAGHIDYVETMCEVVAAHCLEDDRVLEVTVRIEKPQAISDAEAAGVEIVRRR